MSSHSKEEPHEHEHETSNAGAESPASIRSLLNFRQLSMLAIIVSLSAAGLVAATDLAFVAFSLIYMCFISRFAFPLASPHPDPPVFGRENSALGLYVSFAAVIGLCLPIALVLAAVLEGDGEVVRAAAPHLFLLASQVFMEGVSFAGGFSLPVRVFVPVFYNSRRIFTIVDWLRSEAAAAAGGGEGGGSAWKLYGGRALAAANMAFWCFNLFGFLLPVYLPRAFRIYYGSKGKIN
ncbi:NADH-quinone oxidoreductase subunit D [Striga asiatica]|uniref:NADH-quinone oxidoreductase subunit D n=1 Tax=Striga asiatica TaxID=4170 RepID=A0A5A7R0V7_STRAF|nr:NADH-quinone oxidoreductase subunit D [Striga asiatica]